MTRTQLNRQIIRQKRELDELEKWFKAFDEECKRLLSARR